jgi:hypothetical protein
MEAKDKGRGGGVEERRGWEDVWRTMSPQELSFKASSRFIAARFSFRARHSLCRVASLYIRIFHRLFLLLDEFTSSPSPTTIALLLRLCLIIGGTATTLSLSFLQFCRFLLPLSFLSTAFGESFSTSSLPSRLRAT